MGYGGMLTLANVVDAYSRGVDQRRQDEEYRRAIQDRRLDEEAEQSSAAVIKAEQDQYAASGGDLRTYRPSDATMFRAGEARSTFYATRGKWDRFTKNEAALAAQRQRVRQQLLTDYDASGDVMGLVTRWNDTVPNGRKVTGVEVIDAVPESERTLAGASPITNAALADSAAGTDGYGASTATPMKQAVAGKPQMVRITTVDQSGKKETSPPMPVKDLLTRFQRAAMNPEEALKQDYILAVSLAKIEAEKKAKLEEEAAKRTGKKEEIRLGHELTSQRDAAKATADMARTVTAGEYSLRAANVRAAGGDGGPKIQSTKVDSNGHIIGIFRDGTMRRLTDTGGKPIKAQDFSKRVDSAAARIMKLHNEGMPVVTGQAPPIDMEEARRQASQLLVDESEAGGAPASGGRAPSAVQVRPADKKLIDSMLGGK